MTADASAIFATLFGVEPARLAERLLASAKLPVAYDSQEIGKGQPSLASSGSILYALGSIPDVPDALLRDGLAELESWIQADGSVYAEGISGQPKTSWAASLCLSAATVRPSLIGDTDGVRLLARHVRLRQLAEGPWPLREGSQTSHPLYCLYPMIGLLKGHAAGVVASDELEDSFRVLVPYLQRKAQDVGMDVSEQLASTYCLARVAMSHPELVDREDLRAIIGRIEGVLWRQAKLRLNPPTVHDFDQPLWYAKPNRPLHYLFTRRFWPPTHPISAILGYELVVSFDREHGGWRNDTNAGRPYSWTTALGVLAGYLLAADIEKVGLNALDWRSRAESFANESDPYEFDIVISFSGVQRDVALAIRNRLVEAGLRVFYDRDYQHELLGEDLAETLQETYFARSRYAIAVLSRDFVESSWGGNWEWKAILARMVESRESYLLPYRWEEDVEIRGLNPTLGYVSKRDASPEEFAEIVIRKVLASRSRE